MNRMLAWLLLLSVVPQTRAGLDDCYAPPAQYAGVLGEYRSPLLFADGRRVTEGKGWPARRREIVSRWHEVMGPWPALLERPKVEVIGKASRESFVQHRIRLQTATDQFQEAYLLVPEGAGPFAAVLVPFYEPRTSIGIEGKPLRDYAYQLARRGFVTLAIGSPGGSAWKPDVAGAQCQPLSFHAYVASNCLTALAQWPGVDPKRIGIVGHSYGGKWAMFASCLDERFAAAVWSDPGIVFDEKKANVNYWEPWYLGKVDGANRKAGIPTEQNPRTGAYKTMIERGMDLHELHALMAPRPLLVSGGSEDGPERWIALNHAVAVNKLLGAERRVAMHNRKTHDPTVEANDVVYAFLERELRGK